MNDIPRITSAEVVIHGILKIEWNDGYVGVVDLWPVISRGKIFEVSATRRKFSEFSNWRIRSCARLDQREGEEIDFGAASLRQRAEKQSELHRQAG